MILTNDIQYTSYDYDINKDVLDKEEFVKAFNDDVERWTGYDYLYNFDEYGYFHGFPVYMELTNGKMTSISIPFFFLKSFNNKIIDLKVHGVELMHLLCYDAAREDASGRFGWHTTISKIPQQSKFEGMIYQLPENPYHQSISHLHLHILQFVKSVCPLHHGYCFLIHIL